MSTDPSVIRQVVERVAATIAAMKPRTEGDVYRYLIWAGDSPLDQAPADKLYRAFRVRLLANRKALTNSNSIMIWSAGTLEIEVGYPWHLVNANEKSFAGIEATCAEDTADIQHAISNRRAAQLHLCTGPVRTPVKEQARRTNKTQIIPFYLEWGQRR